MSAVERDAKHLCVCVCVCAAFNVKRRCYACGSLLLSNCVMCQCSPCACLQPAPGAGLPAPFPALTGVFLALYIDLSLGSGDCLGNALFLFSSSFP